MPICEIQVTPVVPEGAALKSFWPDWALDADEILIDAGQVTAMGKSNQPLSRSTSM